MQPNQGKHGEIVIEKNIDDPAGFLVTAAAIFPQPVLMGVFRLVATETLCVQLEFGPDTSVTSLAIQVLMGAFQ